MFVSSVSLHDSGTPSLMLGVNCMWCSELHVWNSCFSLQEDAYSMPAWYIALNMPLHRIK